MPHIHCLFVEDPSIRRTLHQHKTTIRCLFADLLNYPRGEVALIPEKISSDDAELADNMLPLVFVADTGTRTEDIEHLEDLAEQIKTGLLAMCPELGQVNFGVWIRLYISNGFAEYDPELQQGFSIQHAG